MLSDTKCQDLYTIKHNVSNENTFSIGQLYLHGKLTETALKNICPETETSRKRKKRKKT